MFMTLHERSEYLLKERMKNYTARINLILCFLETVEAADHKITVLR